MEKEAARENLRRAALNLRSHDAVRDMGSSPLTRGGPGLDWLCAGLFRLIPAYAGRTCLYSAAVMPWAAHPRLRTDCLPIDYDLFGRTFDGLDYRFIKPISENLPDDFELIRRWFPGVDLEMMRYEHL